MFNRRRVALVLVASACLLLASAATAAPDAFTASVTPTAVKPATAANYQFKFVNSQTSQAADRAKIGIPPEFTVDAQTIQAKTAPTSGCNEEGTWVADGTLVADGKINLKSPPGGGADTRLCPGATLTVAFAATSPPAEGVYTWVAELFRGDIAFTPPSSQPTVTVDGKPPTVTIGEAPPSPSNLQSATFSFTVSESLPTQCKLDGGSFEECTSPKSYSNLSDGPHTFSVIASDAAGNSGQASHTWTVETRSPAAAVSSGPPVLTNSRSATFVFTADEPSRFECRLDGASFLPCGSPASYQGLGDGLHTFSVRPIDGVGNVGVAVLRSWRIDATDPQTRVTSGPRSRTTLLSASLSFSASEQSTFQCRLDAGAFTACTSPKRYSRLRRTAHTFQVRAIDAAGNVDPTAAVFRWTITGAVRRVSGASALFAPQPGARVTSPPTLAWRRVPRAAYYNVQLFRGSRKILSVWPTRERWRLRARWTFARRQQRLVPGTYRWYVWPRIGRRYGKLLGQSTFIVRAPARR